MPDMRDKPAAAPVANEPVPTAPPVANATPLAGAAMIAGFWRRLLALVIDMILLGMLGIIIGSVAFRQLVALGQEGRLIGGAITLVYYGFLNSGSGGGATLGKRAMGIRVVRRDGRTIGLLRSLLRTIVFWAPYYLNGVFFTSIPGVPADQKLLMAIGVLDAVVVFGGTILILYLYVFNRRTRQSLHDLVAGTFVVRAESVGTAIAKHVWKGHLVGAALIVVLTAGAIAAMPGMLAGSPFAGSLARLASLQQAILARPGVENVQVQQSTMTMTSMTRTSIIVTVQMRAIPRSLEEEQNAIADIVLKADPTIGGQQYLTVTVVYGYDLGIAKWSNGSGFTGTLADWSKRLQDARQTTPA